MPHNVIDSYVNDFWHTTFEFNDEHRRRTDTDQMYLEHPAIRDILLHESISKVFKDLGMCLALHSDLTYWRSANTGWHVDELNDNPNGADQYVGVWIALDDIDPKTGPFQYIEGSHRWDLKTSSFGHTGGLNINHLCQIAMDEHDHEIKTFLPSKGDVLMWNSRVIHRGSPPKRHVPRPALIGHFSNQWTWSDSTKKPRRREVEKMMRHDPGMQRHAAGWYKSTIAEWR